MTERIPLHHVLSRFFNRPLLLAPDVAVTISAFLHQRMIEARAGGDGEDDAGSSTQVFRPTRGEAEGTATFHSPRASRFYGAYPLAADGRPLPFRRTPEGTAIVTMVGEFVNRGAYVGASSGLISYEGFAYQMTQAAADPQTKAILLDLQSPGGEAVGAFEAAKIVRDVAQAKPVAAVVNGMAASAAYAIASGARRIVTISTGVSGSIGVVLMHLDFSQALAEQGIKPTLIFAGDHKVDGNPFEPLPDAVRARLAGEVGTFYEKFVATVAAGRRAMTEQAVRDTQALTFTGEDAVAAGLADSVGTFEDVLAELNRGEGRASNHSTGAVMQHEQGASVAALTDITTAAALQAAYPALCSEIAIAAATAERGRILGIEAAALPGHEKLVASLKADGKTSPADAALQMIGAEKQMRTGAATAIADVETAVRDVGAAPGAAGGGGAMPAKDTPDGWRATYAGDRDLQAEFDAMGGVEAYVAFMQAQKDGKVRILDRKRA